MRTALLFSRAAAAALVFAASPSVLALAPADIAELAPPRTWAVMSVKNWKDAGEQIAASELGALWREPGVRKFVKHLSEEPLKDLTERLSEANLKLEDFVHPTGHVGLAVFQPAADSPRREAEAYGEPSPELMLVAEFGENAGAMRDVLERVLEAGLDKGSIETETEEYNGVTITTVRPVEDDEEEEPADEDMDDEEDWDDFEYEDDGDSFFSHDRPLFIAEVEGTFVVSSDLRALESAIDGLGGRAVDAVADNAVFTRALDQHPDDAAFYAVVLTEPLWRMAEADRDEEMMEMGMPDPMMIFEGMGLRGVHAAGVAMRFGVADGVTEQTFGILAPEKKGLVALFGKPAGGFTPPGFVGPDAVSAGVFTFDFGGILGVVRSVLNDMPEQQRAQAAPMIEQVVPIVQPALEVMGPAVYMASGLRYPLEADSESQFWAIQVRDELIVSNLLSFGAAQSGFMTPRDFNGNVIYGSDQFPLAVGLGFGHLFAGTSAAVENAMRSAGAADGPRLATEPGFARATAMLGRDGNAYSYADMRQTLQWMYWQFKNERAMQEKQLDEWGLDDEQKAEFMEMFDRNRPEWQEHLPPIEELTRHLGDVVSEMAPTPDGFRGRSVWLRPSDR